MVKALSPRFPPFPFLHGRTWVTSVTFPKLQGETQKNLPSLSGCFYKKCSSHMTSLLVVKFVRRSFLDVLSTTLGQPLSPPGWEVWQDIPPRKIAAPPPNFEWNCLVAQICLGMQLQKFHHLPPTETQAALRRISAITSVEECPVW